MLRLKFNFLLDFSKLKSNYIILAMVIAELREIPGKQWLYTFVFLQHCRVKKFDSGFNLSPNDYCMYSAESIQCSKYYTYLGNVKFELRPT